MLNLAHIIKILLMGTLVALGPSCMDKKAHYIPFDKAGSTGETQDFALALTEDGALNVSWTEEDLEYEVYYSKETIRGSALNFSTDADSDTVPLIHEVIGRSKVRAPMSLGTKLGTTTGQDYTLNLSLDADHYYLVQFVTKKAADKEKNFPVYLIKLDLAPSAEATATLNENDSVSLSWYPVPAATSYDVLSEDGTVLGSTAETTLVLTEIHADYYVRAKRGNLVWTERAKATLSESPVNIAGIEVDATGGIQTTGSALTFKVTFTEAVTVGGSSALPLQLNGKTVNALYLSGSGTSEILYKYIVVPGDNTAALAPSGPVTGQVLDSRNLALTPELPEASAIFPDTAPINIDTSPPSNPTSIAASAASSLDGNATISWNASIDANLAKYRIKLCDDSACSLNCQSIVEATVPTINLTSLSDGNYYSCVQAVDSLGLASSYIASIMSLRVDSAEPTVLELTALTANGTYGIDDVISIAIRFSEAMTVTGTPNLALNSGGAASYVSGSGSDTLLFDYTIASGEDIGDLDQAGTAALTLNGGTLNDQAGNPAVLTLPVGGANNTIGELKAIVIDTTTPTEVTAVTSTAADATYGPGNVIPITVSFSRVVTVSGEPHISLNTTPLPKDAVYVAGSGTATLTFHYTIDVGDVAGDLDYNATTSLTLFGGSTIVANGGIAADLDLPPLASPESIAGSKAIVIDGDNVAAILDASTVSQDIFVGDPIAAVNVNNASTSNDIDDDGETLSYTCTYDTTIDGSVSGGSPCADLSGDASAYSFVSATGVLNWTPGISQAPLYTQFYPYEFAVVATDTAHMTSAPVVFTVRILRPNTITWPFSSGTDSQYTFDGTKIELSGNFARLRSFDQEDEDGGSGGFGGSSAVMNGTQYDSSRGIVRLGTTAGCNAALNNCSTLSSAWVPWSNLTNYIAGDGNWNDTKAGGTVRLAPDTDKRPIFSTTTTKVGSGAFSFDGANDYLYFDRVVSNDFTLSFWMKSAQSSSVGSCFPYSQGYGLVHSDHPGVADDFVMTICGGKVHAGVRNPVGDPDPEGYVTSASTVSDDSWHFITMTRIQSSGVYKLYVDGVLEGTHIGMTRPISASPDIFVGSLSTTSGFYQGLLDDIAIWNTALTPEQIHNIYYTQTPKFAGSFTSRVIDGGGTVAWPNMGWKTTMPFGKEIPDYNVSAQNEGTTDYASIPSTDLTTGLVGLWHLNEEETGGAPGPLDLRDGSVSANHGAMMGVGDTDYILGGGGILGNAIELKGTAGSGIDFGNITPFTFGSDSYTVSTWVQYSHQPSNNARIISNGYRNRSSGFVLHAKMDGFHTAGLQIGCSGGAASACVKARSTIDIGDNKFHHVVLSVDVTSKIARIYVDGALSNLTAPSGSYCGTINANYIDYSACGAAASTQTENIYVGRATDPGEAFKGKVDEIAVWKKLLSAAEIRAVYRRAANRVRFQIMTCTSADCSDGSYIGPDGTNASWFSELNNNSDQAEMDGNVLKESPLMTFSNFSAAGLSIPSRRYYRYRAVLESDDRSNQCNYGSGAVPCSPELQSVKMGPHPRYITGTASIATKNPISMYNLSTFTATTSCAGVVKYQVSADGTNWMYFDGSTWSAAADDSAEANTEGDLNTNITSFASTVGRDTAYLRAYLSSDGEATCTLDQAGFTANGQF